VVRYSVLSGVLALCHWNPPGVPVILGRFDERQDFSGFIRMIAPGREA